MEDIKEAKKENKKKVFSRLSDSKAAKNIKSFSSGRKFIFVTVPLLLLAFAGLGVGYYYWAQYQTMRQNPDLVSQKETEALIAGVGKLMELPKDETPTVATVADKEKVREQQFFKDAENGDKVLIYVKTQKAILYRPIQNKIINVSSVYMDKSKMNENESTNEGSSDPQNNTQSQAPQDQESPSDNSQETLKVAFYNGTSIPGLTLKAEKRMDGIVENFEVIAKENAQNQDYEKSLVADLSGKNQDKAKAIADIFKAEIGDLPSGEARPEADVVVILGKEN